MIDTTPGIPASPDLVTVVMPIYNSVSGMTGYLSLAIQSVLAQTHDNFEFIIVDDGSTDDYTAIRAELAFERRLTWLTQKNQGQSAARNFGASHGHGKWLAFIDHDDAWYPNWLATAITAATTNHCAFVYCDVDEIDKDGTILNRAFFKSTGRGIHPKRNLADVIGQDCFVMPTAMLMTRQVFLDVGGFNPSLAGCEDDDLYRRIYEVADTYFLATPQTRFRATTTSASFSTNMDISRIRYMNILLQSYSKNQISQLVAPRFLKLFSGIYRQAVAVGDTKRKNIATTGLRQLKPFLTLNLRISLIIFLSLPPSAIKYWQDTSQTSDIYKYASKLLGNRTDK